MCDCFNGTHQVQSSFLISINIRGQDIPLSSTITNLSVVPTCFDVHLKHLYKTFYHLKNIVNLHPPTTMLDAEKLSMPLFPPRWDDLNSIFYGIQNKIPHKHQCIQSSAFMLPTKPRNITISHQFISPSSGFPFLPDYLSVYFLTEHKPSCSRICSLQWQLISSIPLTPHIS